MLDPEGHVGHHSRAASPRSAAISSRSSCQPLPPMPGASASRSAIRRRAIGWIGCSGCVRNWSSAREVQRCPKQLHRQGHQLQCRPQRARAGQAQARPVGRGQGGIQQRTPARRHDDMGRVCLAHLHRLPLRRARTVSARTTRSVAIATPGQPWARSPSARRRAHPADREASFPNAPPARPMLASTTGRWCRTLRHARAKSASGSRSSIRSICGRRIAARLPRRPAAAPAPERPLAMPELQPPPCRPADRPAHRPAASVPLQPCSNHRSRHPSKVAALPSSSASKLRA
jgi:hypothetical protein